MVILVLVHTRYTQWKIQQKVHCQTYWSRLAPSTEPASFHLRAKRAIRYSSHSPWHNVGSSLYGRFMYGQSWPKGHDCLKRVKLGFFFMLNKFWLGLPTSTEYVRNLRIYSLLLVYSYDMWCVVDRRTPATRLRTAITILNALFLAEVRAPEPTGHLLALAPRWPQQELSTDFVGWVLLYSVIFLLL